MTRPDPDLSPDQSPVRLNSAASVRAFVAGVRAHGGRVALVPTMGALHDGHLSLITRAQDVADVVIASVFVNPTQFAPGEDFDAYPRTLDRDCALLAQTGCAAVFAPPASVIYPGGHATQVRVAGPAEGLEAAARPHFFHGVATVVTVLFNLVRPDVAVFGEKDYQQLLVIRRLTADLALDIDIVGAPTVRDRDGLAQSSRNAYLTPDARRIAPALHDALLASARRIGAGDDAEAACQAAQEAVLAAGFDAVDYVAARNAETLAPLSPGDGSVRILGAARLAGVRLIDNVAAQTAPSSTGA